MSLKHASRDALSRRRKVDWTDRIRQSYIYTAPTKTPWQERSSAILLKLEKIFVEVFPGRPNRPNFPRAIDPLQTEFVDFAVAFFPIGQCDSFAGKQAEQ